MQAIVQRSTIRKQLQSLNITPIERVCVKWYGLIPHSARYDGKV